MCDISSKVIMKMCRFVRNLFDFCENLQAKSLKTFVQKYDSKINIRTSMSSYRKDDWVTNVPLFCIGNIENILTM